MLRMAHISDLHFSRISKSPLQFFSKRWLGNANLLFTRKKKWAKEHIEALGGLLNDLLVDLVVITGDLTSTSHHDEFRLAKRFVKELEKKGMEVIAIPGNHDHYTKRAYAKRHFYHYFPNEGRLKEDAVVAKPLTPGWWLVALDTALATPLLSSRGHFTPTIESHLKRTLENIPKRDRIIVANHFPFFQNESPRKILVRGQALEELLKHFPNVALYLHGHTHRRCIADLRPSHLPIILDCGSTGMGANVSWNLIDIEGSRIDVQHYTSEGAHWAKREKASFDL